MKRLVNILSLAIVVTGAWMLARPAPASATYLNPWREDVGVAYCCRTGDTASCCYMTGCATKLGLCVQLK